MLFSFTSLFVAAASPVSWGREINKAGLAVASTPFSPRRPWIATELHEERVSHVNNKLTPLNQDGLSYLLAGLPHPALRPS